MSDSRELAHPSAAPPAVRQSENLLAQVIAAAKDPNVDATKMETLARLVNSQQDREREIEFNQSKNAAIMEMPVITKEGIIKIPAKDGKPERIQGRFAKWEDIDRVVRPILAKYNLAMSFDMDERQGGGITVTPILSHTNGYTQRGGAFPVPPETSGSKNAAQAMGSSSSYGKRYAGCAMLNIVTEGVDDDGNMGRNTVVKLPYEREQAVLTDAAAAHEAGTYQEWFTKQSPKDRGYLVSSGKHAEFGGQPQITHQPGGIIADRKRPDPEPEQRRDPPPADPPAVTTDDGAPPKKRTPAEMVEDFKATLNKATTAREIVDLQADPKIVRWMDQLSEKHPNLHQKVVDHAATLYADLTAKEREAARNQ